MKAIIINRIPKRRLLLWLVLLLANATCYSQQKQDSSGNGKTINIIGADRYNFQQKDSGNQFVSLAGNAIVQQENTIFSADSIVLNQKLNTLEAIGNVHINDADSIHTYSQYLRYVGKEKKAYLHDQVKLTDGQGTLTTNDLVYDVQMKTGTYSNGGKVVNGKTVLTSREGLYLGETRDVYFRKKVVLVDPEYKMYADSLLYNLNTSVSTFIAKTKIINGKRTIITQDGSYDTKKKKGNFNSRTYIDDSSYTFAADRTVINEQTGLSEYDGNAVYRSKDSVGGYDLTAGNIKINKTKGSLLATNKPVLYLKQEKDTIYITADTLYSGKLTQLMKTRYVPEIRDAAPKPPSKGGNKGAKKGGTPKNTAIDSTKIDSALANISAKQVKAQTIDSLQTTVGNRNEGTKDTSSLNRATNDNTNKSIAVIGDSSKNVKATTTDSSISSANKNDVKMDWPLGNKIYDSTKLLVSIPGDSAKSIKMGNTNIPKNTKANPVPKPFLPMPRAIKDTNNDRYFEAYYNVKIFSDSMQAVADSMFYSLEDSTFRLYKSPIAWTQQNQITGDTMLLFLENKRPQRLYVYENALTVQKVAANYYNQVKGNSINAYFLKGKMDHLRAKGSAETIYYGVDDRNKFVAVNRATCDVIDMFFERKDDDAKPLRIVLRNNLQGTAYPMRQINHDELRLRGFQWLNDKRPKTKFELIGNREEY